MKGNDLLRDNFILEPGETVRWQGRPAPRCYTFRNWKHALFGLAMTIPTGFWQLLGWELTRSGGPLWTTLVPAPFVLGSLYLAAGHLFLARLEWERVSYVLTDRRIALRTGLFRPRLTIAPTGAIASVKVRRHGPALATVRVDASEVGGLTLHCLEHPEALLGLLKEELGLDVEPAAAK